MIDAEKQRLQERYAAMADEELCAIAGDAVDLTEDARELLRDELGKRALPPLPDPPAEARASDDAGRPVVIAKFISMHEASLAKGQLESAGIPCFLFDENLVRLHWLASLSVGGLRLAVPPRDALEARAILSEPMPESFAVEGVGEFQQARCPKCQSMLISVKRLRRLHLDEKGAPAEPGEEAWHCHECNALWQESDDEDTTAPSNSP